MIGRVLLFAALLATGTVNAQPVRIAHAESFPPFAELRDGASQGLAVDLLLAAAARAGIELRFVPVPFEQLQRTVEDGRAQAIFPTGDTPERRKAFDFSAPLLATGGALYARAPGPAPQNLAGLSGKVVVTPATGPLASFIEKTAPSVKLERTADYEESLARLVAGTADAAALNFHVGERLANRLHPGKVIASPSMFLEVPLAVAVPKGRNAELLRSVDQGIAAIRADGSWKQINERWLGR